MTLPYRIAALFFAFLIAALPAFATDYPDPKQGDWIARDFPFPKKGQEQFCVHCLFVVTLHLKRNAANVHIAFGMRSG